MFAVALKTAQLSKNNDRNYFVSEDWNWWLGSVTQATGGSEFGIIEVPEPWKRPA